VGWDIAVWGKMKISQASVAEWRAALVRPEAQSELSAPFSPPRPPRRAAPSTVQRILSDLERKGYVELSAKGDGLEVSGLLSDGAILGEHAGFWLVAALTAAAAHGGTGKITRAGYGTGTSWRLTLQGKKGTRFESLDEDLEDSPAMRRLHAKLAAREQHRAGAELDERIAARRGRAPDAAALRAVLPRAVHAPLDAAFARLAGASLDNGGFPALVRWKGNLAPIEQILPVGPRLEALAGDSSLSEDDRGTLVGFVAGFAIHLDRRAGETLALALLDAATVYSARAGALRALAHATSDASLDGLLQYLLATDIPGRRDLPAYAVGELRQQAAFALGNVDRPDASARVLSFLEERVLAVKTLPGSACRGTNATLERNEVIRLAVGVLTGRRAREALECVARISEDKSLLHGTSSGAAVAVVYLTTPAERRTALGAKGEAELRTHCDPERNFSDTRAPEVAAKLVRALRAKGILRK
jgi:hypothetical protein